MKTTVAAVAVWLAFAQPASTPVPQPPQPKCCGKCQGGWVLSGDGIARVPCPCPATCPCKKAKACVSGTCNVRAK